MKRNERLVLITQYLLTHPNEIISLNYFVEKYGVAKSSISEDFTLLKSIFLTNSIGFITTYAGVSGGIVFQPKMEMSEIVATINDLSERLSEADRLLPGSYVYLSDLLGNPQILRKIGLLIATGYLDKEIDVIMTIATKGIPIAQSVSYYLNVPFVIVQRDNKITEGPTVSVNYVSGSSSRIEKMVLSRRSLKEGARVLIVDDFMKGGGTISGMQSLLSEFGATFVGATVFAEAAFRGERQTEDYTSLLSVEKVEVATKTIHVIPGNFTEELIKKSIDED